MFISVFSPSLKEKSNSFPTWTPSRDFLASLGDFHPVVNRIEKSPIRRPALREKRCFRFTSDRKSRDLVLSEVGEGFVGSGHLFGVEFLFDR
jgi:hypothetical protein